MEGTLILRLPIRGGAMFPRAPKGGGGCGWPVWEREFFSDEREKRGDAGKRSCTLMEGNFLLIRRRGNKGVGALPK